MDRPNSSPEKHRHLHDKSGKEAVLGSSDHCTKLSQSGWFRTAEIPSSTVLETGKCGF